MAERRGRRGVGQVVGGHIDRLHRGDGALGGRGDPLLQLAHFRRECWLVTHGAGHTTQERGHLGTGLREAEDVVDEDHGFFTGRVAELLGHGQAGESNAEAAAGRLVHLAEHHGDLVDDVGLVALLVGVLGLFHFAPEVVAFACAFADAAEHAVAAELAGDACDHLLDDDGLADTRTAEEADLAASDERAEEVDDLDAGDEDFGLRVKFAELGRFAVDGALRRVGDAGQVVDGVAEQVEDASEDFLADGDGDGLSCVEACEASAEAVGRTQRNAADLAAAQVLLDLAGEVQSAEGSVGVDLDGVVDRRQPIFGELRVERRTDDLGDRAAAALNHSPAPGWVRCLGLNRSPKNRSAAPSAGASLPVPVRSD